MSDLIAKGDQMAQVTEQVRAAVAGGGINTGFVFTAPTYGEIDATTQDGVELEIRVEVKHR